nr:MAG TPA: hypothetical protein [Caudoviricetes sp.]
MFPPVLICSEVLNLLYIVYQKFRTLSTHIFKIFEY